MKNMSDIKKFGCPVLLIMGILMLLFPDKVHLEAVHPEKQNLLPLDEKLNQDNPKIESALCQLINIYYTRGREEAKNFARMREIDMEADYVRVVFEYYPFRNSGIEYDAASFLKQQILSLGGKVEATHRQSIQCVLPAYHLQRMADHFSVKYLRLPLSALPEETSEGVITTGANQWHTMIPYRSQGVPKLCILDSGFDGYENLLGTELPANVKALSFRASGNIYGTEHGTGCAEIVHDMAPDAQLWLVNSGTSLELEEAVDYLIEEGIDIISYSIGWYNAGAGDGTGPLCEIVRKAADHGIIWIKSGGNSAQRHWEGIFSDSDSDGWHEFVPGDELCSFYVKEGDRYRIFLNWNDWGNWDGTSYGGSYQDYDLYLYGPQFELLAYSTNRQSGVQWPVERISDIAEQSGWRYFGIQKHNATKNCKLEVFVSKGSNLEYITPEGSITIPGDSPYAITVGATDWSDDSYHSYSSLGPTSDGRMKPDLCAPSGVSTVSYGPRSFFGTSAACPHVAGGFALIKGKTAFSLEQIRTILEARAKDLGQEGKDNKFGFGRLTLSK